MNDARDALILRVSLLPRCRRYRAYTCYTALLNFIMAATSLRQNSLPTEVDDVISFTIAAWYSLSLSLHTSLLLKFRSSQPIALSTHDIKIIEICFISPPRLVRRYNASTLIYRWKNFYICFEYAIRFSWCYHCRPFDTFIYAEHTASAAASPFAFVVAKTLFAYLGHITRILSIYCYFRVYISVFRRLIMPLFFFSDYNMISKMG